MGHCSFAKAPPVTDWGQINADVAVLGAPNDMGTQWRAGARFGPRGIREAVRKMLEQGAMPVMKAFAGRGPIHILHVDAHLDFVDQRHGVRYGHGNPLRRASEMDHVVGMTQIGIRNVSSSNRDDYATARVAGSQILAVRSGGNINGFIFHARKVGPQP